MTLLPHDSGNPDPSTPPEKRWRRLGLGWVVAALVGPWLLRQAPKLLEVINVPLLAIVIFVVVALSSMIKVMREYERAVVFRLGRVIGAKGPGLIILIPFIDRMQKVSLRTIAMDVPPQDVITRDNVSVKVNAVIYFRVLDPDRAIIQVEDYLFATSQVAQTTLRSILGEVELDDLLTGREHVNQRLQSVIDQQTDPWGIKVASVEVKHVDLPQEMQRAMAKQAEAERERRAMIINAEGEFQAAEKLAIAAERLAGQPIALQLRYLQTLSEVAAENNSTLIFPVPIDMLQAFMGQTTRSPEVGDASSEGA